MTSTLGRLLDAGVVHAGDGLNFHFKGHDFGAKIMQGGLISHCTWNERPVLQEKVAFSTLTDWCDTCIQELVNEYVTRFSSWKRVRHVPTGTPFAQLREKLKDGASTGCNCAAVQVERRKVLALELKLQEMQAEHMRKRKAPDAMMQDDNPFRLKF